MPKVKLDRHVKENAPPIDWLRAAILERMHACHISIKDLSSLAYCHYDSMRKYMTMSPWDWPQDVREFVCAALGLKPIRTVEGAPEEDWRA